MLNKNEGTAENTSMEISDKLRIEAGRESDEEDANTSDFLFFFFTELDAVMGGRASVAPVHILDSSAGRNSTIKKDASDMKARKQRSWLMFLAPPPATLQLLPQLSANPQLQPPLSAAPQLLPPLSAAPQLQPPLSAREL